MSIHSHKVSSKRGSGSRRSRPLVATAAAIGGAGIVLGAPAAGLLLAPAAQAAPQVQFAQVPLDSLLGSFGSIFGAGAASPTPNGLLAAAVDPFNQISNGFLDTAGAIPIFQHLCWERVDGNALHPNG